MRTLQVGAVALSAAASVSCYVDTSPFSLFSTSKYGTFRVALAPANCSSLFTTDRSLAAAQTVISDIKLALDLCPSDHYVIVSQPSVSAADYTLVKRATALQDNIKSKVSIPEVVGQQDPKHLEDFLKKHCDGDVLHIDAATGSIPSYHSMPKVISLSLSSPTKGNLQRELEENEAFFASLMEPLLRTNYTVLWTTTPTGTTGETAREYNMETESQESLHLGLKRNLGSGLERRATNVTLVDGPLFHRYQFFTPGKLVSNHDTL
jgi:hypothetical protein